MLNLIGHDADDWQRLSADRDACLHLYGKREARPGRKMGHVTRLTPRSA
jgi:5-(carboxyamino)imidazole ribonucleotide synthase